MRHFLRATIGLFLLAAATGARAQTEVDPIGSLLDQIDEETAETQGLPPEAAPAPPGAPPPAVAAPARPAPQPGSIALPPAAFPYGGTPAPYSAPSPTYIPPAYSPPVRPHPTLTAPVNVDDYDKTPEAPLNAVELSYENRLRASFASAQGMQGPMDGGWTMSGRDGKGLYAFLLVDKGQGMLEGAWRDLRRRGGTDSSGFLADIQRVGGQITGTFYPRPGAGAASFTLSPGGAGEWTGELSEEGRRTAVTLKRD